MRQFQSRPSSMFVNQFIKLNDIEIWKIEFMMRCKKLDGKMINILGKYEYSKA